MNAQSVSGLFQVVANSLSEREALSLCMLFVGHGRRCRSGVADSFDFAGPSSQSAILLAQQFRGLAIDVYAESQIGQLAGGHAGAGFFRRCAGPFISRYERERLFPASTK